MKLVLTIWISVVLIQEVHSSTLVRLRRHPLSSPSVVHTEYEAKYEQKGNHGNDSFGKVSGKQEILHDNCSENWNAFADKCASLIKDLVASLANAVSSKPGDATQLQLHIKNTFKHFDNTHNCTCIDQTEKALSNIDWSPILSNITIKTVEPTYNDGSSDCGGDSCGSDNKKKVIVQPVSIVSDSGSEPCDSCDENKHTSQTGKGDQILVLEPTGTTKQIKHSNRAFIDVTNPENLNEDSKSNNRRQINYPQVSIQRPQSLSKTAGKRMPVFTITPMKLISTPETDSHFATEHASKSQEQEFNENKFSFKDSKTFSPIVHIVEAQKSVKPELLTSEDCDTDQENTKPTLVDKSGDIYVNPTKKSVINFKSNFTESLGQETILENPHILSESPVVQVPEDDCDETEQPSISVVRAIPSAPEAASHQLESVPSVHEELAPVSLHTIKPLPLVSQPSPDISKVEKLEIVTPISNKEEDCDEEKPETDILIPVVKNSKDECDDCDDKKKPKVKEIAIPVMETPKDECDDCGDKKKPKVKEIAIPVVESSKDECKDCEDKMEHHALPKLPHLHPHPLPHLPPHPHPHPPPLHMPHMEKPKIKEIAIPVMETQKDECDDCGDKECDDCDDKKKPKVKEIAIPVMESPKDECDDCGDKECDDCDDKKKPKVKEIAIAVVESSKDECKDCEDKMEHHALPKLPHLHPHPLPHLPPHPHPPPLHMPHMEKPKIKEIAIPMMESQKDECDDCGDKKKPKVKEIAIPVIESSKDECKDCEEKMEHHALPKLPHLHPPPHPHPPPLHMLHMEKPKIKEIAIPVMETPKDECDDCGDKKKPKVKEIAIPVMETQKDECDDCGDKKKPKVKEIAIPMMESPKDECDDCGDKKKPKVKEIAIPVVESSKDECKDCEEKMEHHALPKLPHLHPPPHPHLPPHPHPPPMHMLHMEKPKIKEIAIPVIESPKDECDDCGDKECDDCDDKKKPKVKEIAIPVIESSKDECKDCEDKMEHHALPKLPHLHPHPLPHLPPHPHPPPLHMPHMEKPKIKEIAIPVMETPKDECDDCGDKKKPKVKEIAIPVVESSKDECHDCDDKKKPKTKEMAIPVVETAEDECNDEDKKLHIVKAPVEEDCEEPKPQKIREVIVPVMEAPKEDCKDCKKPVELALTLSQPVKEEDCDDEQTVAAVPVVEVKKPEEDCDDEKTVPVVPVVEVKKPEEECDDEKAVPVVPVVEVKKPEEECDDEKTVPVVPVVEVKKPEEDCDDEKTVAAVPVVEVQKPEEDCDDEKTVAAVPVVEVQKPEEECDDEKAVPVVPVVEVKKPEEDCSELESKPNLESLAVVQPTTFQTTSVQPTPSHIVAEQKIPLVHETLETVPVIPITSPKTIVTHDDDEDDDEDCCSCESCTEEETTDLKHYKENACRNLEEAKKELKAIFEKIKKRLKCGKRTPHTIIAT